jgi:hypothetical protein
MGRLNIGANLTARLMPRREARDANRADFSGIRTRFLGTGWRPHARHDGAQLAWNLQHGRSGASEKDFR